MSMPVKVCLQTQRGREVIKTLVNSVSYPDVITFKGDAYVLQYTLGDHTPEEHAIYHHRHIVTLAENTETHPEINSLETARYGTAIFIQKIHGGSHVYIVCIKADRLLYFGRFYSLEEARKELAFAYKMCLNQEIDTSDEMPKVISENGNS